MNLLSLLAAADPSNLLAARLQMAFTLGFHIAIAVLGVGMPVLMLFAEWRAIRTGDDLWRTLAKRWSKVFAVLFAVGAVSGTVLSFELGLLWPEFMGRFGSVIGLAFTLEGFAFFLEAIFVGIYLYAWDRLPPRTHWWAGVPVAISGALSAWFVVTANAWMNQPTGFTMDAAGRVTDVDPLAAMFNPATGAETAHMIVAAYMVSGFVVAGYYAWCRLQGDNSLYTRRAMAVGLSLGVIFSPVQVIVGDWISRMVADTQPVKLAAMEGQFKTEAGAPLRIGGFPDETTRTTPYAIEIPYGLSLLAYHDPHATVAGLDDLAAAGHPTPPVAVVHFAFQIMVGIGTALLGLSAWVGWNAWRRRRLPDSKWFLTCVVAAGPLSILALEAGWTVTEVGRQPWIVHGILRTRDAVTLAPGIWWTFGAAIGIYTVLLISLFVVLRLLARVPMPGSEASPPDSKQPDDSTASKPEVTRDS